MTDPVTLAREIVAEQQFERPFGRTKTERVLARALLARLEAVSGEYELRCLSPQDLLMLGGALERVYSETQPDGELRWPGKDTRAEELWFLIAMVLGHEGGGHLRLPRAALAAKDETA